jgi:hypothetical protein
MVTKKPLNYWLDYIYVKEKENSNLPSVEKRITF